jgi:hypothetical protein
MEDLDHQHKNRLIIEGPQLLFNLRINKKNIEKINQMQDLNHMMTANNLLKTNKKF